MEKQQMPMNDMHDTFWRNDQVTIIFHSDKPFIVDGVEGKPTVDSLLNKMRLQDYLDRLSSFLHGNNVPVTLHFLDESNDANQMPMPQDTSEMNNMANASQLPPGVYAFGFPRPIESDFGPISTSVISFLRIEYHGGSSSASMGMPGSGTTGNGNNDSMDIISQIVKTFNENLNVLNGIITDENHKEINENEKIPITIAAPSWLTGGTPTGSGAGCPLSPPIPVKDACSNWHIRLPHLPDNLKSKKGDGVTVFILDSFPERGVIARAARDAGDDNLLLKKVNETVTFDYSFMSGIQDVQEIRATSGAFVGKDVYGRHYAIHLEDHGLFIAGIVRDLAPRAQIECIRVLDDLCIGDLNVIANALNEIYLRKALKSGDLYGKPVVVNLSLVIPTDNEARSRGIDPTIGSANNVWAALKHPLEILSQLGIIITTSAGNEGDERGLPGPYRPQALYPAAFAYEPYTLENVIPVGAVESSGKVTSYSCYSGIRGIATYGGEVPAVVPPSPPNPTSGNPDVRPSDMMRGIYSSVEFPPLSLDPPAQYYTAPNEHAWAYWVGTSFATPIVSALATRVLELQASGLLTENVRKAINDAATDTTVWDRLDPSVNGTSVVSSRMLTAIQYCVHKDRDEMDDGDDEV